MKDFDAAEHFFRLARTMERNQRRHMAIAVINAVLSLGLQVAGGIILWRHDPWLVLAMGLMLWGYGIGLRAVFMPRGKMIWSLRQGGKHWGKSRAEPML